MFSIIIPVKGRQEHLKITIPHATSQQNSETIVVDFDCPDLSGPWVKHNHPKVIVVSASGQPHFSPSKARNLGAAIASHEWLVFLDVDIKLKAGFLERLAAIVRPGHFYLPRVRNHGFAGFIVLERSLFKQFGGYDPSYRGFGIEDDDLIMAAMKERATGLTLESAWIGEHLPHDDASRIQFYSQATLSESLDENARYFLKKWGESVQKAVHRRGWESAGTSALWSPLPPLQFPSHRLGMKRLHLPEEDAFNGSLISTEQGQLLFYRSPPYCACIMLNERLEGMPKTHQSLNLWRNDDPRVFRANGHIYLSTSYHGGGFRNERVELRRVHVQDGCVSTEVIGKFDSIENDPQYVRTREKNWAPFEHNGRILYVHKAQPHRILEVDTKIGTVRLIHETQWMLPQEWHGSWGRELRLNAPPFRLSDGRYISTLHTRHGLSYRTWFYTFSAEPPFQVQSVSAAPVLLPGDAVGLNTRNRRHRCIFITGLQVVEERDSLVLSGGNNDTSVIMVSFALSEVLNNLTPVGDPSRPIFLRESCEVLDLESTSKT